MTPHEFVLLVLYEYVCIILASIMHTLVYYYY